MTFKVIHPEEKEPQPYDVMGFEKTFGIQFLSTNIFEADEEVKEWSSLQEKRGLISLQEKWFGTFYRKEILCGAPIDATVRWIDPDVGYGLFLNASLPPMALVGEYVGLVKKRLY